MVAMVFSAQCRLLGGAAASHAATTVTAARPASLSYSSSSTAAPSPRFVRLRASSAEASPAESSSSSEASASSTATVDPPPPPPPEPESASIDSLEIASSPTTSTSLVAETSKFVTAEGLAGLAQVNHYEVLKIRYGSSLDQIIQAYRSLKEEVKSQEKELGEEAVAERLAALQVSFDILSSEEERRVYDWVLRRYESRTKDTYIWPYEADITQRYTNKEPVPVMRSFDQEGNNRVGLFLLGWVIISIIFGVTMKTHTPYPHWKDLYPAK